MRERIDRRQALLRLGAPAVVPLARHLHPALPPQEGEWAPRFLRASEVETVAVVAERIIPRTDTPGARDALVHQYIDFALSEGEPAARERFREGLAWLEGRTQALYGQPFAQLTAAQQEALLARIAESTSAEERKGAVFFADAKRLTVDGYYRSEIGMKQELGFDGRTFLAGFEGCTHPEHHAWKPGT
jgi:hypothetical protein